MLKENKIEKLAQKTIKEDMVVVTEENSEVTIEVHPGVVQEAPKEGTIVALQEVSRERVWLPTVSFLKTETLRSF